MIASIHCIQGLFCLSLRLGYSRYIGFSTPCLLGKCRTFGNRKLSWNFRLIFGPIQQKPIGQCANVGGWIIGCMEFLTVDGTLEPSASPLSPQRPSNGISPPHIQPKPTTINLFFCSIQQTSVMNPRLQDGIPARIFLTGRFKPSPPSPPSW